MTVPDDFLTLDKINGLGKEEFVRTLGGIFEHSPWVAEGLTRTFLFSPWNSCTVSCWKRHEVRSEAGLRSC